MSGQNLEEMRVWQESSSRVSLWKG